MEVEGKINGIHENSSDDEEITLPSDTLLILQQFLAEKAAEDENLVEENWQLSQFWYDEETISLMAGACKKIASGNDLKIGLFSCPSLYEEISRVLPNVWLFEYDERFLKGDRCIFYDYTRGKDTEVLGNFHEFFDLVIADPPFLSEECISKTSDILMHVLKSSGRIILCSGVIVAQWAEKFLKLQPCKFHPKHKRNLGNEFASFANFNLDDFIGNTQ
uniref:Protein-lysine N-methyltransferase n=1 Tax=Nyssomyia neivai TaxID=330878 RepID=A0A1L8DCL5_9DIPT